MRKNILKTHFKQIHRLFFSIVTTILTQCVQVRELEDSNLSSSYVKKSLSFFFSYDDEYLCQTNFEHYEYICRREKEMRRHCNRQHQIAQFASKRRLEKFVRNRIAIEKLFKSMSCQRIFIQEVSVDYFEIRFKNVARFEEIFAIVEVFIVENIDSLRTKMYDQI